MKSMDSVRQMGVKHKVKMTDMNMNVHVCTVIQIYMILCNLVVFCKRGVLTTSSGRGAQQTFSMVVAKRDLRTAGKYMNIQMYK